MSIARIVSLGIGAAALAASTAVIVFAQQQQQKRAPEVQQDLETAMKGEAFAYAKYSLYAEQARARGHADIAALFERTAKTERLEHFREHAELAGFMATSDADNLRDAMKGEAYETKTMYPEMAARARKAGDAAAASRFAEIGGDESKHHDEFAAALSRLEGGEKTALKTQH